jgi:AAA15 family ATPase/GTPase
MTDYTLKISIKAKNYKCFGDDQQGFEIIKPINLIIGRNNSGKSALLDLVKYFTSPYDLTPFGHKRQTPEIFLTTILNESDIKRTFSTSTRINGLGTLFDYGSKYIGKEITVKSSFSEGSITEQTFVSVDNSQLEELDKYDHQFNFKKNLAKNLQPPLRGKLFKKVGAERDIQPEVENTHLSLTDNGSGATNLIQAWLNNHDKDARLIEQELLNELNAVFQPDGNFTRILVKKKPNGAWEIYLEEENKGLISLSDSGSGLKTIILVLLITIVIPKQEGIELGNYIFAFEELENNLHPALLRRLLGYITRLQERAHCYVLLTTHSSTTIDFFGKNENSQIIHVRNDGSGTTAKQALAYTDNTRILDDLDVRASDILQSNGIVWVEGPSDRIYLNKWISLWSEGLLEEGIHYQCLMYGGKLLAHLSVDDPGTVGGAISILRANRNVILMMDSDKATESDEINSTKKRVIAEIEKMNGLAWLTAGREIENYIPVNALRGYFNNQKILGPSQYTKLPEYLKRSKLDESGIFNKVKFAQEIEEHLQKSDLEKVLDLNSQMEILCNKIKSWNGNNF